MARLYFLLTDSVLYVACALFNPKVLAREGNSSTQSLHGSLHGRWLRAHLLSSAIIHLRRGSYWFLRSIWQSTLRPIFAILTADPLILKLCFWIGFWDANLEGLPAPLFLNSMNHIIEQVGFRTYTGMHILLQQARRTL